MVSLGVDIGGTGCKCVAFSDRGAQLALAYREYPNPPGKVNLDPIVLRDAVFAVIGQCAKALPDPKDVAAITVSSFGESFVPVGADGAPLTDIVLYFANSESDEFDRFVEKTGPEKIMEITRVLPDASYSLAKMLAVKKPVWKYLFVAGYLCYCLSGQAVCDVSLACRSLLYDVKKRAWSGALLDASGVSRDQLPTVLPTGSIAGPILPEAAAALGLSGSVQIVIGSHDQIVNALGAGVSEPGEAVNITGTCECIEPLFQEMPGFDFIRQNFACVPYLDGRGYVTYAYNISGGAVVKWYRDTLAAHLRQQAEEASCSIYDILNRVCPKEPTSLIVLPYLQGMGGTPDVRTDAVGHIAGLTASTTLPDLYRGILEGLCFEMQYNLEKLAESGIVPGRLYACGGGARSDVWLQIKADVWNREILPVESEETGALGSAILGFSAVTGEKDRCALSKTFVRHRAVVHPDPARHACYQKQYELFKKLRKFSIEA